METLVFGFKLISFLSSLTRISVRVLFSSRIIIIIIITTIIITVIINDTRAKRHEKLRTNKILDSRFNSNYSKIVQTKSIMSQLV